MFINTNNTLAAPKHISNSTNTLTRSILHFHNDYTSIIRFNFLTNVFNALLQMYQII